MTAPTLPTAPSSRMAIPPEITPPQRCALPPSYSALIRSPKPPERSTFAENRCTSEPIKTLIVNAQTTRIATGLPSCRNRMNAANTNESGSMYSPAPIRPRLRFAIPSVKNAFTPQQPSSETTARTAHTTPPTSRRIGLCAAFAAGFFPCGELFFFFLFAMSRTPLRV